MIRTVHNVDIMHTILFTEFQQLLLKFQKRLILDSDTSDSENDKIKTRKMQRKILENTQQEEQIQFKKRISEQMQKWLKEKVKPKE